MVCACLGILVALPAQISCAHIEAQSNRHFLSIQFTKEIEM